jgi:chromosome segregation ATPase
MSSEPKKPAEALVQDLLTERRELKVMIERMRLELADVRAGASGPDPRVKDMDAEIERLRHQLATSRAEAGQLREERDELRGGIEHALDQLGEEA